VFPLLFKKQRLTVGELVKKRSMGGALVIFFDCFGERGWPHILPSVFNYFTK
jgi:hypothetical protein